MSKVSGVGAQKKPTATTVVISINARTSDVKKMLVYLLFRHEGQSVHDLFKYCEFTYAGCDARGNEEQDLSAVQNNAIRITIL